MPEPITFVVERAAGGECASIIHGTLPERLTRKGSTLLVWAYRLDKLPAEQAEAWCRKPVRELHKWFDRLRAADKLPAPNLADPPRKVEREQGVQRGPEYWWKPPPPPRGEDEDVTSRRTYTIEEVGELLGLSRNSAYVAARENRLPVPTIRIGKRMMVSRAALDRLLNSSEGIAP